MSLNCSSCPECYENITITVQTGLAFQANDSIQLYDGANAYIYGSIVSYDPITGVTVITPCQYCGEIGAITGWTISLSGIPGVAGSSGTSGTSGTSATSGTDGTSGSSGTSGSDGTSGTTGTSGTSGTDGTSGTSGTSGTDGTSGTSGGTGSSGSAGSSGTSGTSGGTGSSGSAGSSGTSGTSGTSGSSGTAGTAGSPGTSGTSGTSGLTPNPNARNETTFTATAGQTVFSVTYNVGQVDVYYNGSKLSPAEFTATNGTSITLATPCIVGDIVDVVAYVTGVTGTSGTAGTSGTSGTTGTSGTSGITPANQITGTGTTNTLPKFTSSTSIGNSLFTDNGTNGGFGGTNYSSGTDVRSFNISAPLYAGLAFWANNVLAGDIFGYGVTGNLIISADPTNVFSSSNLLFNVDGTTRLTIASTGAATFSGKNLINIGTSGATASTAADGLTIDNSGNGGLSILTGASSSGYLAFGSTSSNIGGLFQYDHSDNGFKMRATEAGSYLQFHTAGTDRMTITSGGNVGIGTASPTQPLHVAGTAVFTGTSLSGNTAAGIYIIDQAIYSLNGGNSRPLSIQAETLTFFSGTSYAERLRITSNGYTWVNGAISGFTGSGVQFQVNGQSRMGGTIILHNTSNAAQTVSLNCTAASTVTISDNVVIVGSLSKGSGSFRIEHPLPSLSETHQLVHSFIEGPQADLIYRGKLTLVNGKAQANIDEVSTMTEGTFEVLCREVQCFTTNESGWDLVKGKVIGNIIYIESQNKNSTDEISWMVIGERKDKHIMDTEWTDENGKVIVEPLKPIEPEPIEEVEPIIPEVTTEPILPTDNNLE